MQEYDVKGFYVNEDYEPYAFDRDQRVASLLALNGIKLHSYTDHVVFKPGTILNCV